MKKKVQSPLSFRQLRDSISIDVAYAQVTVCLPVGNLYGLFQEE